MFNLSLTLTLTLTRTLILILTLSLTLTLTLTLTLALTLTLTLTLTLPLTLTLTLTQVRSMLHTLFTLMDFVISIFQVKKIESVGDSYMCVSGLNAKNDDEVRAAAEEMVDFSIAIQEAVKRLPLKIRIGLHRGSVAAGMVGSLKKR